MAQAQPVAQPPAQQPPPPQQPPVDDAAVIAALTLLLLHAGTAAAFSPAQALQAATSLLGQVGVSPEAAGVVWNLAGSFRMPPATEGSAGAWVRRTAAARRAAYALNAARRLDAGEVAPDVVDAEHRHMGQHDLAEAARERAGRMVDEASARHGLTLGWVARMDSRTTEGCRAANGKNFDARKPPIIEGAPNLPGTPHGGTCRCVPGPPHPRGEMLPS